MTDNTIWDDQGKEIVIGEQLAREIEAAKKAYQEGMEKVNAAYWESLVESRKRWDSGDHTMPGIIDFVPIPVDAAYWKKMMERLRKSKSLDLPRIQTLDWRLKLMQVLHCLDIEEGWLFSDDWEQYGIEEDECKTILDEYKRWKEAQ